MNRTMRFGVVALLFVGLLSMADGQVALAARSSEPGLSVAEQGNGAVAAFGHDDDCSKDKDKDHRRGRHRDKHKHKCRGTVKPPPSNFIIPVTGEYSVGGYCTLSVGLIDPHVILTASLQAPLPRDLPRELQNAYQGCLLTYYRNGKLLQTLTPNLGGTSICFAAVPDREMMVYFFDLYEHQPKWSPLETTLVDGIACAAANASGIYIPTFPR